VWGTAWIICAQKVLADAFIDVWYGAENLTWALMWDHTVEYARAVALTLEEAWQTGGAPAVKEALSEIEKILNQGEKFRGLPKP